MEAILLDLTNSNKILSRFINSFLNGFRRAGGSYKNIDLFKTQVSDCRGCTEDLFFQYDGTCRCLDEFSQFYPLLREHKFWFFAIDLEQRNFYPLFINLLNRMEPLFQPNFNGEPTEMQKFLFALIFSGSKNRDIEIVEQLMKEFSQLYRYDFLGMLHRPNYDLFELLPGVISNEFGFEEDFDRLGFELARTGKIDRTICQRLERNILPEDSFLRDFALLLRSF